MLKKLRYFFEGPVDEEVEDVNDCEGGPLIIKSQANYLLLLSFERKLTLEIVPSEGETSYEY